MHFTCLTRSRGRVPSSGYVSVQQLPVMDVEIPNQYNPGSGALYINESRYIYSNSFTSVPELDL